jgi:hypothetical protein
MLRRRDLLLLCAALPAAWVAGPVQAEAAGTAGLRRLPLRGLERHQGRALWPVLATGDRLRLAAAPHDESNRTSIAVYWGEFLIGHLPAEECGPLQACLARGELQAEIAQLDEHPRSLIVALWNSRKAEDFARKVKTFRARKSSSKI